MNRFYIFILVLLFSSCAQRLKVPINRMISPEVIGKGMEVQYDQIGFSSGILNLAEGQDSSLLFSQVNERALHLGIGLVDKLDIFVNIPKESSSRVGLKIQLLGAPEKVRSAGNKLALILATGSSTDIYTVDYKINIASELKDYALIHGYRFSENLLVYESLSITNYEFHGTIVGNNDLNFNKIKYYANNTIGLAIGAVLGPPSLKAKAELAMQRIFWSHTEAKNAYSLGYSLTATW